MNAPVTLGPFEIEAVALNHSIPDPAHWQFAAILERYFTGD